MTQVGTKVQTGADSGSASDAAVVLLAKQKMLEAELEAEAAGKAAFTARTAYERLKKTENEMAQKAAEATLNEIKKEAAGTATKAKIFALPISQTRSRQHRRT